jgi:hypothetical protein
MHRIPIVIVFIAGAALLLVPRPSGMARASDRTTAGPSPIVNPAAFPASTTITNRYYPLKPGTTFLYKGEEKGGAVRNTVVVTRQTKVILGVRCVVVRDRVTVNGELIEDTWDWYAQDTHGNVWYFGEYTTEFQHGVVTGHAGSWQAGVQGARPGIAMLGSPRVGQSYHQEARTGVAQDMAAVLNLSDSVCVPYGCYHGKVLVTKEWSPLEPDVIAKKYYAPGVGMVKMILVRGGPEQVQLVGLQRAA